MKVLAIETATTVCAVAIVDDGRILADRHLEAKHVHSEKLMIFIDECLSSSGITLKGLDGIAVSIGPGSFTGLRIGLSVAKGLALATGKFVVGVPTLSALALQAVNSELVREDEYIIPMIDARRDELYTAVYQRKGHSITELLASQAIRLHEVMRFLPARGTVVVMGDGANKFQQFLVQTNSMDTSRIVIPVTALRSCTASSVGLLGASRFSNGEGTDGAALEPLYVKEFYTTATIQQPSVIL